MIKDSWEHRVARMHPQTSKMDWAIYERLKVDRAIRASGWKIEWQKPYCLLQTIPEFTLSKAERQLGVYLDAEFTHKNRQLRDEELRRMLKKRRGITPLSITYKRFSLAEQDRVYNLIKEAIL